MATEKHTACIRALLTVAVVATLATGCETTRRRSNTSDSNAVLSAASRLHDEQIAKLNFSVNQLKEDRAALERKNAILAKRVANLESRMALLSKLSSTLNAKINAEMATRKRDDDALLKHVAKQLAAALNSPSRRPAISAPPATRPASGEFYEYTVEQGATLIAIAKAYKVSVADIKKANRLKSDNIRVGQKLLIPKKQHPPATDFSIQTPRIP